MRRTRFQQGSLQLVDRSGGKKTWEYRWYELQSDGRRRRRNLMVGSLEQYPNETGAQKAVAANPIRMVRQSAKRTRIPIVLSIEQVAALLRVLKEPTRTMVFVAVFTGLRVGELLGLKWSDIDLQKMVVHVVRSIVMQHVGDCKTEASRKPVPLDLRLAKVLWDWRLQSPYPTDEDWVFASPHSGGKLPYWPGSLYKAHLEPAAKEVGIVGHFGWHTFRHYAESGTTPNAYATSASCGSLQISDSV
ncbi:MAG: tyrosine-type recombinase/integrase [Acidobacteriia bacterium]|nr:tyrosine-type recombinase/integrase [Terriglobia bacterium]